MSSGLHSHPFDAGWASSYMAWQSFGEGDDCDTLVHGVTSGGEFRDADEREREAFDAGWTAAHAEDED